MTIKVLGATLVKTSKHLRNLIDRRKLTLANNLQTCQGKFTRIDPNGEPSIIIDLILANETMQEKIQNINIDEKRIYTLTRYEKVNGIATETPSDHNTITQ